MTPRQRVAPLRRAAGVALDLVAIRLYDLLSPRRRRTRPPTGRELRDEWDEALERLRHYH